MFIQNIGSSNEVILQKTPSNNQSKFTLKFLNSTSSS